MLISLENEGIANLDLADNLVIFAEPLEVLFYALDGLSLESEVLGQKVFWVKTKN